MPDLRMLDSRVRKFRVADNPLLVECPLENRGVSSLC